MGRVVHFEIHSSQPEKSLEFYQKLFGWTFSKWEGPMEYWTIVTGSDDQPGINGGLMRRHGAAPQKGQAVNAYVCTVTVDSIDDSLTIGQSMGAQVALPKMPIPGIGWLAYLTDVDGNIFGLMQADPAAQ